MLKTLHWWHLSFEKEKERTFYGQSKFRLWAIAPGYERFYREPTIYLLWCQKRKQDYMRNILQFTLSAIDTYKKLPIAALRAPPVRKTRWNYHEAELFQDHITVFARKSVTPHKLLKTGDTGDWAVEKSNKLQQQGNESVALDPFCTKTNMYHLLLCDYTKNCPKNLMQILQKIIY